MYVCVLDLTVIPVLLQMGPLVLRSIQKAVYFGNRQIEYFQFLFLNESPLFGVSIICHELKIVTMIWQYLLVAASADW